MNDQGSSYTVLQDIPVIVSPQYRLPKQILIDNELVAIPKDTVAVAQYSFSVERQTISSAAAVREKQQLEQKARKEQLETYKADKLQQKRMAARKIAPGFLDTDTRILQPLPFRYSKTLVTEEQIMDDRRRPTGVDEPFRRPSSTSTNSASQEQLHRHRYRSSSTPAADFISLRHSAKDQKNNQPLDYQSFEHGLTPMDPWDTPPGNDMMALQSILGKQETNSPSPYPQPKQYQHAIYPSGGDPWAQYPPSIHPPPPATWSQPSHFVPALPPKVLHEACQTTSSPLDMNHGRPNDVLVQELANMGFSHAQASDALRKNENDLTRATHFLLDNS